MIDTVKKMKEDVNRCNGYYLMKTREDSELLIGFVHWEGDSVEITGDNYRYRISRFHWIADEPLDLEQISLLHKTGYACTCND